MALAGGAGRLRDTTGVGRRSAHVSHRVAWIARAGVDRQHDLSCGAGDACGALLEASLSLVDRGRVQVTFELAQQGVGLSRFDAHHDRARGEDRRRATGGGLCLGPQRLHLRSKGLGDRGRDDELALLAAVTTGDQVVGSPEDAGRVSKRHGPRWAARQDRRTVRGRRTGAGEQARTSECERDGRTKREQGHHGLHGTLLENGETVGRLFG